MTKEQKIIRNQWVESTIEYLPLKTDWKRIGIISFYVLVFLSVLAIEASRRGWVDYLLRLIE